MEQRRGSSANLIIGLVLVALGIIWAIGQLFTFDAIHYLWPFFIIIPGLAFFAGMVAGGRVMGPLAIPGSIITMVGLILFYQNLTGLWASWAYIWTLIAPTSVGIGLYIYGVWSKESNLRQAGRIVTVVGLALFVFFGAFFELLLNISGRRGIAGGVIWPLGLILLGVYILLTRGRKAPGEGAVVTPVAPAPPPPVVDVTPAEPQEVKPSEAEAVSPPPAAEVPPAEPPAENPSGEEPIPPPS
jgi:hypothetical protein